MKFYSSVSEETIKHALFRGTFLAGTGAILLVMSGIWIPAHLMSYWGIYIWSVSLLLIAWGLLPYQYLQRLSKNPNRIELDDSEMFHYFSGGKQRLCIPLSEIEQIEFYDKPREYGLLLKAGNKSYTLPYFTRRSYEKLVDCLRS